MDIYVPFNDQELVDAGDRITRKMGGLVYVHGHGNLSDVAAGGTLYVLGHGRYSRGDQICGIVKGRLFGTRDIRLSPTELASQLDSNRLAKGFGDLRLMMCWGGYTGGTAKVGTHTRVRDAAVAPFAGQLCSALKAKGYSRMIVTGYTAAVLYPKNSIGEDVFNGVNLDSDAGHLLTTGDTGQSLLALLTDRDQSVSRSKHRTVWY